MERGSGSRRQQPPKKESTPLTPAGRIRPQGANIGHNRISSHLTRRWRQHNSHADNHGNNGTLILKKSASSTVPLTSDAANSVTLLPIPPSTDTREQETYLPIANVVRIMRRAIPPQAKIGDDAKDMVQECVTEFISFITAEANDRCNKEQRKTITADDLIWAMARLGFEDYVLPLSRYLQRYREIELGQAAMRQELLPIQERNYYPGLLPSFIDGSINGGMLWPTVDVPPTNMVPCPESRLMPGIAALNHDAFGPTNDPTIGFGFGSVDGSIDVSGNFATAYGGGCGSSGSTDGIVGGTDGAGISNIGLFPTETAAMLALYNDFSPYK
ncbi:hypothetical protein Ancab_024951 [Ancistrocladus abbreviatus]